MFRPGARPARPPSDRRGADRSRPSWSEPFGPLDPFGPLESFDLLDPSRIVPVYVVRPGLMPSSIERAAWTAGTPRRYRRIAAPPGSWGLLSMMRAPRSTPTTWVWSSSPVRARSTSISAIARLLPTWWP